MSVQLEEFTDLWPVWEEAQHYANNDDCITPPFNIFFLAGMQAMEVAADDSSTITLFYKSVTTAFKDQHFRTIHYVVLVFPWSPCGSYWWLRIQM
jgi:hypothetical protein